MADYKANVGMLPEHMQQPMSDYIEKGIAPGSFLSAVLSNDLMGAFGRADSTNIYRIKDFASFLYNHAPSLCHGSPTRVAKWIEIGGLNGYNASAEENAV